MQDARSLLSVRPGSIITDTVQRLWGNSPMKREAIEHLTVRELGDIAEAAGLTLLDLLTI